MTDARKYRMRLIRAHMDYITAEINDIDKQIESLISSDPDYDKAIRLLTTIPGVKRDSAITIISEIGIDMSQFCNSKRLCCWAGLTPGNNESAGKKKSVRITHAGLRLTYTFFHIIPSFLYSTNYNIHHENISSPSMLSTKIGSFCKSTFSNCSTTSSDISKLSLS